MKLFLVFLLFFNPVFALDIYGDAYRFSEKNSTGKLGLAFGGYNAEYSFEDGFFAIGGRKYLSFTNLEIGIQGMVSNKVNKEAIDYRVIDIEGGYNLVFSPYFKAGSLLFAILKIDESNTPVVQFGFALDK